MATMELFNPEGRFDSSFNPEANISIFSIITLLDVPAHSFG